MRFAHLFWLATVLLCAWYDTATTAGTVTMDGSLPGAVSLSGSTYTISSGRQSGPNQFYSFGKLNLVKGDTASFSATSGVSNVFARVTGGQSSIDGTISAPTASFFLIDNQGVIFGPDASLNVGGVFAVTTADELKFADGKVFTAMPSGSDATLSTAAPSAFGFLSASPQAITINGSTLSVSNQQPLTVVGGKVTMTGGTLQSSGGRITVASVASPGTVTIDPTLANSPVLLSGFSGQSAVCLTDSATITTDGNQGGQIVICGGQLMAGSSSTISAQTTGTGNGVGIDIELTGALSLNGSNIVTDTNGAGAGGSITVSAADVTVENAGSIAATTNGSGRGGDVTVSAATLSITNLAEITTATTLTGAGGNCIIKVSGAVILDGGSNDQFTGISAETEQLGQGAGNGGNITLTAGTLAIKNGAEISSSTFGPGAGGNCNVMVSGDMILDGGSTESDGGIFAEAASGTFGGGNGGNITVTTGTLSITNGAEIDATTKGSGAGGGCNVKVFGAMTLDAGTVTNPVTGVTSETEFMKPGGGAGGDVTVSAGTLSVSNGAQITASTEGTGAGGNCDVTVYGSMTLDGSPDNGISSAVSAVSDSEMEGGGNGGDIIVSAGTLALKDGGEIVASTSGTGAGGSCKVMVSGAVTMDGENQNDQFTGIGAASELATPGGGNGGNITLRAGTLSITNDAAIGVGTYGFADAGSITVMVRGATLFDGGPSGLSSKTGITALSSLENFPNAGAGGNITLDTGTLSLSNGAEISAASLGSGAAGSVSIYVQGLLSISNGSTIGVSSAQADGGDVSIGSADSILISQSTVSASAADVGGNITLTAPNLITVANSTVDGHAGKKGGQVTIDPQFVIIGPDSTVNGLSNGQNVLVLIQPSGGFLLSSDSQILTNRQEFTVNNDIVAGLTVLQTSLADLNAQLAPTCSMFAGNNSSTLIESSNGGLPPQPGGWTPVVPTATDSDRPRRRGP